MNGNNRMEERQSKTFVFSLVEVSFMANTKVNNKSDNKYDKRFISYSDFVISYIEYVLLKTV